MPGECEMRECANELVHREFSVVTSSSIQVPPPSQIPRRAPDLPFELPPRILWFASRRDRRRSREGQCDGQNGHNAKGRELFWHPQAVARPKLSEGCRLCTVQCFADARAPLFLFQHSRSGGEKEAFTQLHRFTGTADLRTCGSYESRVGLFRRLASTEGQG
ncbi:hypothetical protein L226DRAFT_208308 [Lentinus tigrinus ALCF2SS1-7]|uniref:uncharacterized protein n=1 Tax=Lentinus tigrinus ALCF2SS1-7 TaxID=1328758 RepID=UPI001165FD4C|nr:hypothetical protein L226DRAFT_208308 [Lentinus tigrinus ALCF2SS1-7]